MNIHRYLISASSRCLVLFILFSCLPAVHASHLMLSLNELQPVDEAGMVFYAAREPAHVAGDPDRFKIKGDVWIDNNGTTDLVISGYTISFPGSGIAHHSAPPNKSAGLPAGGTDRVAFEYDISVELVAPLPPLVRISIEFEDTSETFDLDYPLEFYENKTAVGSLVFPMSAHDMGPGESWYYWGRHVDNGSTGRDRYAYDFGVVKWHNDAYQLVGTDEGGLPLDGWENSHYYAFGDPLYAMADGTVVRCTRGMPDETPCPDPNLPCPGSNGGGGGNELLIQHGEEAVRYSHIMDGTLPYELCPYNDATDRDIESQGIQVEAGQQIGLIGNSGKTAWPHLHISVHHRPDLSQPLDVGFGTGDSRPLNFHNIRIASDPASVNNLGSNPAFRASHGRTVAANTLIVPNLCDMDIPPPGLAEESRHGIPAECYQDVFNLIVTQGYRPVFVDGYDVAGETYFNATFRPAGPASVARHGLTGAEYQDLFNDLTGSGFRLHQVDSYLDAGNVRYAAIFENRPGPNFAAFHGLDDSGYADALDDLTGYGLVPVNISAVTVGGQQYWTGLFEHVSVTGWTVETVPVGNYQAVFNANIAAGRLPIYVHGVSIGGSPYLTGIWIDPIGGSWQAQHGLSSTDYQDTFVTNLASGRYTRYTTGYDNGAGSARFAAVWRGRPNTTISQAPSSPTNQATAAFGFGSNNPFTTFQCQLDSASAYTPCNSLKNYTGLGEGNHVFRVRAVDREGMHDLSPAVHNWQVDLTPPDITITAPATNTKTVNGALKEDEEVEITTIVGWGDVVADVTDNLSGVASVVFKVNGVPVAGVMVDADTWKTTFQPDLNGENIYLVEIFATDNAGNASSASMNVSGIQTGKNK